jgi:putative transposase
LRDGVSAILQAAGALSEFKKKGVRDSARLDNGPGTFKFKGKRVRLPVIGWVKLREELRFSGKALSTTVRRVADRWLSPCPSRWTCPKLSARAKRQWALTWG